MTATLICRPASWRLRFAADAQIEFNAWRADLEQRLRADEMPPALEAHLAKYRSLVPSLALLFHLADCPAGGPVGLASLLRALAWAEYLETHARRVYAIAQAPGLAAAKELAKRLDSLPNPFRARDVSQKGWRLLDREGTASALSVLTDYGWLASTEVRPEVGRPSREYHINPALVEANQ